MRKRDVLQLTLQLNFWVALDTCNSLYLYAMSDNGQMAWVVKLQSTAYTVQLITIQLQLCQNNSFSTII
jgi:hypothetical protein